MPLQACMHGGTQGHLAFPTHTKLCVVASQGSIPVGEVLSQLAQAARVGGRAWRVGRLVDLMLSIKFLHPLNLPCYPCCRLALTGPLSRARPIADVQYTLRLLPVVPGWYPGWYGIPFPGLRASAPAPRAPPLPINAKPFLPLPPQGCRVLVAHSVGFHTSVVLGELLRWAVDGRAFHASTHVAMLAVRSIASRATTT